jgi:hypothetical protein
MEWPKLRELIRAGDVEAVTAGVSRLSEDERRALAPGVTALERSVRRWRWPAEDGEPEQPFGVAADARTATALAVAAAGVLPAAKLGPVLGRIGLGWRDSRERVPGSVVDEVLAVLVTRGLVGEPAITAQVARRVRLQHFDLDLFDLAYRLAVAGPGAPPDDAGFVLQWMSSHGTRLAAELRERPAWAALVPRFLAVRGGGQLLDRRPDLRQALVEVAAAGLVGADALLDACLAALQVSRRRADLMGLLALHQALAPSDDAVDARVGDYVALAAGGASFVAKVAQERLRALDDAGRLDAAVVAEVSRAVLLRPEKGLARTQLAWLRAALRATRGDADAGLPPTDPHTRERLLRAAAAGFSQPDAALQARALEVLAPHATGLSADARRDLAREAGALVPDLRPRAAELFGTAETLGHEATGAAAVPARWAVGPPPPAAERRPVGSAAELAECLARYNQDRDWDALADHDLVERLLDGLVRCSWSDREGVRDALAPLIAHKSWLKPGPPDYSTVYPGQALRIYEAITAAAAAAGATEGAAPPGPAPGHPPLGVPPEAKVESPPYADEPDVVLFHRFAEVAAGIWWAPVPMLLAAPTTEDGVLDAGELARRLAAFEAAGCRPWPHDLVQALLRVTPADLPALHDAVHRLTGSTGASLVSWLANGGSAEGVPRPADLGAEPRPAAGPVAAPATGSVTDLPAEVLATWARLRAYAPPPRRYGYARRWSALWLWQLPFARDVVATRLVHRIRDSRRGDGRLLVQLATAHGTLGPASYLVLAHGLNLARAGDRAGATDALLTLAGRGQLDATALGEAVGSLVADRTLTLNRVVPALRDVGAAGAWPPLWELLAAALPRCLPGREANPAPQLAELLALAVETVHAVGTSGRTLPGLDAVAARPGTSRLRTEALRLQAALATG